MGIEQSIENTSPILGHFKILKDLEDKLSHHQFNVETNETYAITVNGERLDGEIDLYAINRSKKIIVAIEVKGAYSHNATYKACYQLLKDWAYLQDQFPDFSIALMYAYGKRNNDPQKTSVQKCNKEKPYTVKKYRKGDLKKIKFP